MFTTLVRKMGDAVAGIWDWFLSPRGPVVGPIKEAIYTRALDVTSWTTHFCIVHFVSLVALIFIPHGLYVSMAVTALYIARETFAGGNTFDSLMDGLSAVYGFVAALLMVM